MKISTCCGAQMSQHEINKHWQCGNCGMCSRYENTSVALWNKNNPSKHAVTLKALAKRRTLSLA
jgi:hypothetical protein